VIHRNGSAQIVELSDEGVDEEQFTEQSVLRRLAAQGVDSVVQVQILP
jgi:hypothetical protein